MYNERSLQAYHTINKRVNILLIKKGLTPKDKQSATAKVFRYMWWQCAKKGKNIYQSSRDVGEGGGIISEVKGNSQINFGRVRLELKPPNRHSGNDGPFSNTLLTDIYLFPLKDIENLKRSLHYAKHVLQADYENKLQERALDL